MLTRKDIEKLKETIEGGGKKPFTKETGEKKHSEMTFNEKWVAINAINRIGDLIAFAEKAVEVIEFYGNQHIHSLRSKSPYHKTTSKARQFLEEFNAEGEGE